MKKTFFTVWCLFCFSFYVWPATLADAQAEYLAGNLEGAIGKAEALKSSDASLYFLGLVSLKRGDYKKARIYLNKLTNHYPHSQLYPSGLLKLADSYFLEKEYQTAQELYKDIQKKYPSFNKMPSVLLRLAQIASRQGKWTDKKNYLEVLKNKYSGSSEMKFVKALENYGDFFTIQVGAFSDKKNARALHYELAKRYKGYLVEDKKGSYPLYKVRVGKYKKRFEVEKISRKLLNEGYPARIYP